VTLYAESSAILTWLLGEPHEQEVRECLASADLVVASDLTLIECNRVLIRAAALGDLPEAPAASLRADLAAASAHWTLIRLAGDVIDRARRPFALEPVRTLDALHLASALAARARIPDLAILSLDGTIRDNARAAGLDLLPAF
jgi:predicted nucleic acid-binding protein